MNGRKVEDGGILYDENETDDEDELQEAAAATAAVTPGIDWNEGGGTPEGLVGAELIAEFVKHLPNAPGVYRMFNEA
ncbi:MAG TPA: excinuclease ABC subunit C, partial [Shinella sp.]|nr:excinuclease ABC subunit C [Shinella sp.]